MSIRFDSEARIFVLETAHTSYHMSCIPAQTGDSRRITTLTAPTGAFPRICSRRSIPAAMWAISVSPA